MQVFEYAEYRKSLVALRRKGGAYQKAAERAIVIQDDLRDDELRAMLPVTNNGETRIKKAVKYDIGGNRCRLITIQDSGFIFLCYAGSHDEADAWLSKNRGLTVRVDERSRPVATHQSFDISEPETRLQGAIGFTAKPLLTQLDERLQDALLRGINWRLAQKIGGAEVHISDDEIEELAGEVDDHVQRNALFDVLIELRAENVEAAVRRVRAFTGELQPVDLVAEADAEVSLVDSSDFQNIRVDSDHYRRLIEHYATHADFKDWMLFMHPDQQQYVDADYAGPTKLSGVSGSGKTCVVVRRALALADKYPDQKVLVLTLNRSLATLIQTLVDKASPPGTRERVDVLPFFKLCQNLLTKYEPANDRLYDDVTWKAKEHIDEIWREFYRCELNNFDARVLQRLHDSLIARGIDAERYVREEFDWIRSATLPTERASYLKMERGGRTYPLDESFRKELLVGLEHWEAKMKFVGVTDYLGVANALFRHSTALRPMYRCVLIDECQDFGTIDIRLVRHIVAEGQNDVFLCGDAAQQVSSKSQNLTEAGLAVPGARSHRLSLNYRNSRQILEVAHGVLMDNLAEEMLDSKEFEVLDPGYANFGGPTPLLLHADSGREELRAALSYAHAEARLNPSAKVCVAVCGYSEHELTSFALQVGLPLLNGEANLDDGQVFVSDLENTKGFEFQCVVIANCSAGVIPNPRSPEDEAFRDLSRLYVAMTRARQQLVISFSGAPSEFISGQVDHFMQESWTDYLAGAIDAVAVELPRSLEQLRRDAPSRDVLEMTGEEYLYDEHAIGCPQLLVEKLRTLVSGKRRVVSGNAVEWTNIWGALKDTSAHVRSRQHFGPEGYRLFRERFNPRRAQS